MPTDEPDLRRLAALDSAPPLRGPVIVAEEDGAIVAALSLSTKRAVTDPFVRSLYLVDLLRRYAIRRNLGRRSPLTAMRWWRHVLQGAGRS